MLDGFQKNTPNRLTQSVSCTGMNSACTTVQNMLETARDGNCSVSVGGMTNVSGNQSHKTNQISLNYHPVILPSPVTSNPPYSEMNPPGGGTAEESTFSGQQQSYDLNAMHVDQSMPVHTPAPLQPSSYYIYQQHQHQGPFTATVANIQQNHNNCFDGNFMYYGNNVGCGEYITIN